ncbi:MAG TPA: ABC transporter ATP-binding protein [Deltaproteobacteria bacterium]|nr:ABC transporter ATP-binding protein [Deltaproteobacteria bacterium]HPJ93529.1 ABC transporter ATP-binding protein [Deltaproteobacteria bacterium]HPR51124.1 ABC transporter ATP-binding protein [Deltaproteobacteria bacterium]
MKSESRFGTVADKRGEPLLVVEHISKVFHLNDSQHKVLEDICFCAYPSEMICIVGRSGCGKTTLLNILAGFERPTSGYAAMNREIIRTPGPDRCVVFQEDTLFPWLTVEENIAFGLKNVLKKTYRKREVDRYLELVGLQRFRHYLPREISGGMKQRVALARVLIMKPQVLLMDEPFASLDYHTRRDMQELLVALWEELGHTIIFVTHDIDEAITLADNIMVMDTAPGRIREKLAVSLPRPRKPEQSGYLFFRKKLLSLYEHYGELAETGTGSGTFEEDFSHSGTGRKR